MPLSPPQREVCQAQMGGAAGGVMLTVRGLGRLLVGYPTFRKDRLAHYTPV